MCGEGVVDKQKAAGVEEVGDSGFGEGLMEEIVINKDVGGDDEIEAGALGRVEGLGDDIEIDGGEVGGEAGREGNGAREDDSL